MIAGFLPLNPIWCPTYLAYLSWFCVWLVQRDALPVVNPLQTYKNSTYLKRALRPLFHFKFKASSFCVLSIKPLIVEDVPLDVPTLFGELIIR